MAKPPPVEIPSELQSVRVLGLGMAGIDILATVDAYPQPDQKVRTKSVSVLGGGNTANVLTAVRRLGLPCRFVSKVGKDMYGEAVLTELKQDGVDVEDILVKEGVNTAFTYVIVDARERTRTCISTASNEELSVTELSEEVLERVLRDVALVALDGRHTLAALQLAKFAKTKGVPILLDVERERPFIRELLPYADYIMTNSRYPFVFFPDASDRLDAMQHLLETYDAKFVMSTLGASGSIMVLRETTRQKSTAPSMSIRSRLIQSDRTSQMYEIIECPACPVENIADTTGAGDAFIGGVIYGLVTKMPYERMMCLASHVASAKIGGVGARTALPRRENLPQALLGTLPNLRMAK